MKKKLVAKYPEEAKCRADGCDRKAATKWLCRKHYYRLYRHGDPETTVCIRGDDDARFKSAYKVDESGCWVWQRPLEFGYGTFSADGRIFRAHRYSWERANGPIPEGLQINHRCHNRACVNPDHLYAGNQLQNMADMIAAGRSRLNRARGERAGNAKLTTDRVRMIRETPQKHGTVAQLAREHGVSESLVRAVRQGKVWKHVDGG